MTDTPIDKNPLNDRLMATDLLLSAKSLIKHLAAALTETATVELRMFLKQELDQAVAYQEKVLHFVSGKGWHDPYHLEQQLQADLAYAAEVLQGKN